MSRNTAPAAHVDGQLYRIPVTAIRPFGLQPRSTFDDAELQDLAEDLRARGQDTPIIVRYFPKSVEVFELIAGERRLRAAKLAGLESLLAVFRDVDTRTALAIATAENAQRASLNPIDLGRNIAYLEADGYTQEEIGKLLGGKSQSSISHLKRLQGLPPPIQEHLKHGRLSASHGKALLEWQGADQKTLILLADAAAEQQASVSQLARPAQLLHEHNRKNAAKHTRWIGYNVPWARNICHQCPWKAFDSSSQTCLRPSCFEQLTREHEEREQQRAQELIQEIRAEQIMAGSEATSEDESTAPRPVRKLSELKWGKYEHCNNAPAGCTKACPCRAVVEDYDGKAVEVCLDPKRFNRLKAAANRVKRKNVKETLAADWELVRDQFPLAAEVTGAEQRRALAMLCWRLLRQLKVEALRELEVPTSTVSELLAKQPCSVQEPEAWKALASSATESDLIRLTALAVSRHEQLQALSYDRAQVAEVDWLLGRLDG